jgi:O-6-methylguanine DNA methyltransferase
MLNYRWHDTLIGRLLLVADDGAITGVFFADAAHCPSDVDADIECNAPVLERAMREIDTYLEGTLMHFTVPLAPSGTAFQRLVWGAIAAIPYGATRSYRDIARLIGVPGATRAVGTATGRNPLSLVVPCHRVIASNGGLAGYAGGVARKHHLLALERGDSPAVKLAGSSLRLQRRHRRQKPDGVNFARQMHGHDLTVHVADADVG